MKEICLYCKHREIPKPTLASFIFCTKKQSFEYEDDKCDDFLPTEEGENKMKKPIYHWQIDDKVYFLDNANNIGEFPCIFKGIVEEIKRDSIRVKISFKESTNLVWVRVENCFNSLEQLKKAFLQYLEREIYIINNPDKVSR